MAEAEAEGVILVNPGVSRDPFRAHYIPYPLG